jgi:hypothetical protein
MCSSLASTGPGLPENRVPQKMLSPHLERLRMSLREEYRKGMRQGREQIKVI